MARKKKNPLSSVLSKLRKNLFGETKKEVKPVPKSAVQPIEPVKVPTKKEAKPVPKSTAQPIVPAKVPTKVPKKKSAKRDAYYIQIGLDFGTSFSKCVIRDVGFDRAQVYLPPKSANDELPFLMPTTLRLHGTKLSRAPLNGSFYGRGYLPFIKMALASSVQGKHQAACLTPYRKACEKNGWALNEFIMAGAVFYLAKSFEEISDFISKEFSDFGKMAEDQQFVNVSIPIFKERNCNIERAFNRAIKIAWEVRKSLRGQTGIDVEDLLQLVRDNSAAKDKTVEEGAPFLYPEVSAGLQVYARSNSFPHSIYIFSDAGAGTVDQAVFTYHKNGFSFLGALVSPLGSSQIEAEGALQSEYSLEELRIMKESGDFSDNALREARNLVGRRLEKQSTTLIADTRDYKLYLKDQIQKASLLFSGGGHCADPYEFSVRGVFNGPLFSKKVHMRNIGMPDIHDLEFPWNADRDLWVNRLHVAYGLSLPDYELKKVKLPDEISDTNKSPISVSISS